MAEWEAYRQKAMKYTDAEVKELSSDVCLKMTKIQLLREKMMDGIVIREYREALKHTEAKLRDADDHHYYTIKNIVIQSRCKFGLTEWVRLENERMVKHNILYRRPAPTPTTEDDWVLHDFNEGEGEELTTKERIASWEAILQKRKERDSGE